LPEIAPRKIATTFRTAPMSMPGDRIQASTDGATVTGGTNPQISTDTSASRSITRPAEISFLLLVLLIFYGIPIIISAYTAITRIGSGKATFDAGYFPAKLLLSLADRTDYTAFLHQMILPVLACFTALNFNNRKRMSWWNWLFIVPLFFMLISVILGAVFHLLTDLEPEKAKMIAGFFVQMAQNFSLYILMLLGLQGGAREPSKEA
jgi:hypothetical protein